ncbi:Phosphatidylcholine:diacylglycerol cholinephosphotransferase 1 [Rhynchospora pubera]|uniref:Phosphatidylcholine:diacylglycerol cholinephosphotransferase 1 n=1 Tax=Rhynchospora pubera TaxID=906938 RepID=A0AAV8DT75_9POAL|nr:Phosphatidylcholine:diacylglycerol cholinephosphotransferase 1 [Rhynchospora pubera]
MEEISSNVERIIPLSLDPGLRSRHLLKPKIGEDAQVIPSDTMEGILPSNSNEDARLKGNYKASPAFVNYLSIEAVAGLVRRHPASFVFSLTLLFFMGVEYTIPMVPSDSAPLDLGFRFTESLNAGLAARPNLNSFLAALNTVFVAMQSTYIFWSLLVEGRPRATIASLFMFTCRGILGSSTQLPLPKEFQGSGADFPVGNVSFFLFFSGHVAGSMIASLDMRRMKRYKMAWSFDALNILQAIRLLASRGHYTIDLATGLGAGFLFDILAGRYLECKSQKRYMLAEEDPIFCQCCCNCKQTQHSIASS